MRSAMSLAISIEPMNVMYTSAITHIRRFPNFLTIFLASMKKKLTFLSAHTTASTQKRQVSVLKSKYPRYSLSMGTKNMVISIANRAITNTVFLFINLITCLKTSLPFYENCHKYNSTFYINVNREYAFIDKKTNEMYNIKRNLYGG